MRVLHVIPSLDPADGGPPVVVIRLAAAQAAAGADVSILFYERPGAHDHVRNSVEATPGGQRLRLHPLPAPTPVERFTAYAATRALRSILRDDADFLHVHGIWTPILAAAAKAAAQAGIPYCITPHGMLDPWCLAQKALKKRLAIALSWRRLLNRAAFIHALNTDEARLMAPLAITAPVEIIPNGIFIEEFENLPPRDDFRAQHPDLAGDPYVLFLSRLHHKKGLDLLAPAFARLLDSVPKARLVVAGPDGGARAPFEQQIQQLRIQQRVHVVGPIYGGDKLAALAGAACFCLPSRQEGFSIAITEALACGLPCVITADCHYPEVSELGAGRVTTPNPDAIAAALAEVLADPALSRQMGQAGFSLVRDRFTWPRIARKMLDSYTQGQTIKAPS